MSDSLLEEYKLLERRQKRRRWIDLFFIVAIFVLGILGHFFEVYTIFEHEESYRLLLFGGAAALGHSVGNWSGSKELKLLRDIVGSSSMAHEKNT